MYPNIRLINLTQIRLLKINTAIMNSQNIVYIMILLYLSDFSGGLRCKYATHSMFVMNKTELNPAFCFIKFHSLSRPSLPLQVKVLGKLTVIV